MGIERFSHLASFIISLSLIDSDPIVGSSEGIKVFCQDQEQHETTDYISLFGWYHARQHTNPSFSFFFPSFWNKVRESSFPWMETSKPLDHMHGNALSPTLFPKGRRTQRRKVRVSVLPCMEMSKSWNLCYLSKQSFNLIGGTIYVIKIVF